LKSLTRTNILACPEFFQITAEISFITKSFILDQHFPACIEQPIGWIIFDGNGAMKFGKTTLIPMPIERNQP
jgi:hypothetical protein